MISEVASHRLTLVAITLVCAGGVPAAQAQSASAWEGELHAAARLIGGSAVDSGGGMLLRAGLEIRLDPGWKTYWRYPGDPGVPPTLDFAGSENVKSVTALSPRRSAFLMALADILLDISTTSYCRCGSFQGTAKASRAYHVKLGYAVCGSLCVPAEANLHLTLSGKAGADGATPCRRRSARAAPRSARRRVWV